MTKTFLITGPTDGVAGLMNTVKSAFPEGKKLTPTGWTAEGNRVATEVESYGEKSDGYATNSNLHVNKYGIWSNPARALNMSAYGPKRSIPGAPRRINLNSKA